MKAVIKGIDYFLPQKTLTNDELAQVFPDWSAQKIFDKTGIRTRHIAGPGECASDLAIGAAKNLLVTGPCKADEIDYLIFATQSPDYHLPTSACLIQNSLGLRTGIGAIDLNQGCSAYIYGLSLAKGLIETGQAKNVLFLTAETYSKFINPGDKSVRALFGDAGAATLISCAESEHELIGSFVFGTDGAGAGNLMVPTGGMRKPVNPAAQTEIDASGNRRTENDLFMNGPEIFDFTLRAVPESVSQVLQKAGLQSIDIDLYVFHQANRFMLEHLRKKLGVPSEKFVIAMEHCGNTVSASIPIALKEARSNGVLKSGMRLMLVGFGVGYSWGGAIVRWTN
jgi:3-oxoacyl-[acyl-carrier-protein] synthase-3